jgi:uncharacterized protein YndB with AHSA1/START domain
MSRTYERTFSVSVGIERAWHAMTDPAEASSWMGTTITLTEDGFENSPPIDIDVAPPKILEADAPRMLRYEEPPGGNKRSTTVVTILFEEESSGTRITFTRAGFGDDETFGLFEAMAHGTDETLSDFILYLETGVAFPRHFTERSYPGIDEAIEIDAGLSIAGVAAATFASRLGLQDGDILVELGGAPVFGRRELFFFAREHAVGEEADAAWIRDGVLMRGRATLGPRERATEPLTTSL